MKPGTAYKAHDDALDSILLHYGTLGENRFWISLEDIISSELEREQFLRALQRKHATGAIKIVQMLDPEDASESDREKGVPFAHIELVKTKERRKYTKRGLGIEIDTNQTASRYKGRPLGLRTGLVRILDTLLKLKLGELATYNDLSKVAGCGFNEKKIASYVSEIKGKFEDRKIEWTFKNVPKQGYLRK
jgi:hypothetical protein